MDKISAWEQYKKNLGETRPWHMISPIEEHASDKVATERYSLCLSCPELISMTKQCKKCGCFMAMKTKLTRATCPLGKW
jgi:hypothetical protein